MKPKFAALLSGIATLTLVASPIRPATQEHSQRPEVADKPDTSTTNPVPFIDLPLVPDAVVPLPQLLSIAERAPSNTGAAQPDRSLPKTLKRPE